MALRYIQNKKRRLNSSNEQEIDVGKLLKTLKSNDDETHEGDPEQNPLMSMLGNNTDLSVDRIDNHIYFRDDVHKNSVVKLINHITEINNEFVELQTACKSATLDPKPIYLHITSNGGNILYSFMAYDAIKRSKIPIHTVIEGFAFSGGSVMYMAGQRRYSSPNTVLLMHQIRGKSEGTYEELKDQYINDELLMKMLKNIYLENTNMKSKDVDALLKKDMFLDTNTCLKYGLTHEIYTEDK